MEIRCLGTNVEKPNTYMKYEAMSIVSTLFGAASCPAGSWLGRHVAGAQRCGDAWGSGAALCVGRMFCTVLDVLDYGF